MTAYGYLSTDGSATSSCLHPDTALVCVGRDGRRHTMTARAVMVTATRSARGVVFLAAHYATHQPVAMVCRAVEETLARAYRVTLTDGRSVTLTGSHILPGRDRDTGSAMTGTDDMVIRACRPDITAREFVWAMGAHPMQHRPQARNRAHALLEAGGWRRRMAEMAADGCLPTYYSPLRPGDLLLDGVVDSVEDVGLINAVRIWTDEPHWLVTDSGLRLGTRVHELVLAWVASENLAQFWAGDDDDLKYADLTYAITTVNRIGFMRFDPEDIVQRWGAAWTFNTWPRYAKWRRDLSYAPALVRHTERNGMPFRKYDYLDTAADIRLLGFPVVLNPFVQMVSGGRFEMGASARTRSLVADQKAA